MDRGDLNSSSRSELFESLAGQDSLLDQLMDKTDMNLSQLLNNSAVSGEEEEEETGGNVFEAGRQVSSPENFNSGQVPSAEEFNRGLMMTGQPSLSSTMTRRGLENPETGGGDGGGGSLSFPRRRTNNVSSSSAPTSRRVEGTSSAARSSSSHPGGVHSPERRNRPMSEVTNHRQQLGDGSSSNNNQRQGGGGGRKRVSGQMEVRDNQVILEIRGLDTWGIDPNNIKIIDSLDAEEEVEEEQGQGSAGGLKQLKIVGLRSQEKRFRKDGSFGEKFRLKYTKQENTAILSWLEAERERQEGEISVKGIRIWKRLEESGLCPGRSWHSLKQHWKKNLKPNSD